MLRLRLAQPADLPALTAVMDIAIGELQRGFLTPEEISASRAVMGIDTQLVRDGTYFVAEIDGVLAGCGGWSRRATLYGGDHSTQLRDAALLDPAREDPHALAERHRLLDRTEDQVARAGRVEHAERISGALAAGREALICEGTVEAVQADDHVREIYLGRAKVAH